MKNRFVGALLLVLGLTFRLSSVATAMPPAPGGSGSCLYCDQHDIFKSAGAAGGNQCVQTIDPGPDGDEGGGDDTIIGCATYGDCKFLCC